jgi:hypothetical protein
MVKIKDGATRYKLPGNMQYLHGSHYRGGGKAQKKGVR